MPEFVAKPLAMSMLLMQVLPPFFKRRVSWSQALDKKLLYYLKLTF